MKRFYLFLLAMIMLFPAIGQDKLRVAVFDPTLSGTEIDEGTRIAIREIISSTIVNDGQFNIVERSLLDKVMEEQSFSQSGAVDDSQMTEIGKLAGANKVVIPVVAFAGGQNVLSIKMIDVKTANVDKQKVKAVNPDNLLGIVEPLTLDVINGTSKTIESAVGNTLTVSVPKERNVSSEVYENALREELRIENEKFKSQTFVKAVVPVSIELTNTELLHKFRDNTNRLFLFIKTKLVKETQLQIETGNLLSDDGRRLWEFLRDTKRIKRFIFYDSKEKKSKEFTITPDEVFGQ